MSDNKDVLLSLLGGISHVDNAQILPIDSVNQKPENEGFSAFVCSFKNINNEDKIAVVYLGPASYEDPSVNDSVVESMTSIVNHLYNGGTIANYQPPAPPAPPAT